MGGTLPISSTTFNRCVQVQSRADHLSSDTGALLLREIMERTGIVEWMTERLVDPRNPHTVSYPLADQLQTSLLLLGQGWRPGRRRTLARRPGLLRRHRQPPRHRLPGAGPRAALAADDV